MQYSPFMLVLYDITFHCTVHVIQSWVSLWENQSHDTADIRIVILNNFLVYFCMLLAHLASIGLF